MISFGSSPRELGIAFLSLPPILKNAGFFLFQVLRVLCKNLSEVEERVLL